MRVDKDRVLNWTVGSETEEVTENWTKLRNKLLSDLN